MAKNVAEVVESAQKEVMFDFKKLVENPDDFSEWLTCGDKGIPFEFFDNEWFKLPKFEKIQIWGRHEKIGKKSVALLYTAITSKRQGAIEVPLSIFRRIPALKDEVETLKKGNEFGAPLLTKMPDTKRLEILSKMAGDAWIVATDCPLHTNDFDANGKVIKDDPNKDEKDRKALLCHRFNPAVES